MRYGLITVAALAAAVPALAAASPLSSAINTVGVYGEGVGVTNGNSTGGIGVHLSGLNRWDFFTLLDYNYAFDNVLANTDGHYQSVDAKIGKAFSIGPSILIGPYVGYQYANFYAKVPGFSASYDNNAVGGGLFGALAAAPDLVFTGNVGYLGGVGASGPLSTSDVVEVRTQADYRIMGPWYAFAGLSYNHYTVNSGYDLLRGYAGLSYTFD